MTARLPINGAKAMTAPLQLADGTASAPSLTFGSATNVGLYRTTNGIGVTINGTLVCEFSTVSPFKYVGEIIIWPSLVIPTGCLSCSGQSLLRATYPALFAALGTTYGAVDATHFSLPNLNGAVPAGLDLTARGILTGSDVLGTFLGSQTHTLNSAEMPVHSHVNTLTESGHAHTTPLGLRIGDGGGPPNTGYGNQTGVGNVNVNTNNVTTGITITNANAGGSAGITQPHPNVQPTVVMNMIIYTGVA